MDSDVVVIGAGLAGLQCARLLTRRGLTVEVLERGSEIGGRVRTQAVDGFRCDRGFQVLNPAYPAVRRHVDVSALSLRPFGRGLRVRRGEGTQTVAVPWQSLRSMVPLVRTDLVTVRELAAFVRWMGPALAARPPKESADDQGWHDALDRANVTGNLRTEVLEPFLTGVILENDGSTSANFVRLLLRTFVFGRPSVPAQGMAALPHHLAEELYHPVRTRESVAVATGTYVETFTGRHTARAVVVATDATSATRLTSIPVPAMKGLVTDWFATDEAPTGSTMITVEARRGAGPVVNTAVMSNIAPSYAPAGRHLIQATCLMGPGQAAPSLPEVRTHLADIYGCNTKQWESITRDRIADALPAQPAPLSTQRPVEVDGLFICGDHRDTASIQGALVSGTRCANAVLRKLRPKRGW